MKILFVCSANICRSPMAAEYMRHRAARSGLSHVVVDSAGILGIEGESATREAIDVLREHGLDLSAHRSRGVTQTDLRTADLVAVMTLDHLEELDRRYPGGSARRVLLRAFQTQPEPKVGALDLEDPIGMQTEHYRQCFETIRACVDHLTQHLKHRA